MRIACLVAAVAGGLAAAALVAWVAGLAMTWSALGALADAGPDAGLTYFVVPGGLAQGLLVGAAVGTFVLATAALYRALDGRRRRAPSA